MAREGFSPVNNPVPKGAANTFVPAPKAYEKQPLDSPLYPTEDQRVTETVSDGRIFNLFFENF